MACQGLRLTRNNPTALKYFLCECGLLSLYDILPPKEPEGHSSPGLRAKQVPVPIGKTEDPTGLRMEAGFLLGLTCLCSPLAALVLDFNTIRGSAEVSAPRKSTQCLTDKDCPEGKFCHKPREEPSSCATCHGLRRRCQRSTMCCPGMLCINDVCSQTERVMVVGGRKKHKDRARVGSKDTIQPSLPSGHVLKEGNPQMPPGKAQEGESCLRTADCVRGLCCARHFWAKVCKPVLMEGQVCSRRGGQKEGAQGPEIFQRCNCAPGLSCQLPLGSTPQRSRLRVCLRN